MSDSDRATVAGSQIPPKTKLHPPAAGGSGIASAPMAGLLNSRRGLILGALLIGMVALVVFHGQLSHGFTNWDDTWLITENRWIQSFAPDHLGVILNPFVDVMTREELGNEYLPVRDVSSMVNYAVAGYHGGFWHGTDLLLHAIISVLVMLLTRALLRNGLLALLAGLIFAVMPIHVEVVAWASSRKDLLATLFGLASVMCYLRWRGLRAEQFPDDQLPEPASRKWLVAGVVCFVLALFSKAPVIILPGFLVLSEVFLRHRLAPLPVRKVATAIGFFFGVAVLIFAAIHYPIANNGLVREPFGGNRWSNTLTALAVFPDYLAGLLLGWPIGPAVDAPLRESVDGKAMLGLLLLLAAVGTVGWFGWSKIQGWRSGEADAPMGNNRKSAVLFGLGWLLVGMFPVSNLLIVTGTAYADRYAYLPSVGVAIALVAGVPLLVEMLTQKLRGTLLVSAVLLGALVPIYGAIAAQQVPIWRDSVTLWTAVLEQDPTNHNALFNRGVARQEIASTEPVRERRRLELAKAEADLRLAFESPGRTYRWDPARVAAAIASIRLEMAGIRREQAEEMRRFSEQREEEARRLMSRATESSSRAESNRFEQDAEAKRKEADGFRRERFAFLEAHDADVAEAELQIGLAHQHFDLPWRRERDRTYMLAQLLNLEGLVADRLGRDQVAEQKFRESSELALRNQTARLNLAMMLARRGEIEAQRNGYPAAKADFEAALAQIEKYREAKGHTDLAAISHRAQVLTKQAEAIEGLEARTPPPEAAAAYKEAASLFGEAAAMARETRGANSAESFNYDLLRSEVLSRLPEQSAEAAAAAREAAQRHPDSPVAALREVQLLIRAGKSQEALPKLVELTKRFPDDSAVRAEMAAVYSTVATSRWERLIAKWSAEYRAAVEGPGEPDHHLVIARFRDNQTFATEFAAAEEAYKKVSEFAEPGSKAARLVGSFLTTVGHASFVQRDIVTAEDYLRRSYAKDPDLKLTSELLAAIYFGLLEDLTAQGEEVARAEREDKAAEIRREMWEMIANLVAVSPRAAELLAAQFTRKGNQIRTPIDDKYVRREDRGFDPTAGSDNVREWVPEESRADYIREMQPVVQLYELARTLDPSQAGVLSQLNDYYSKTREHGKALATYRELEKVFEGKSLELLSIRKSIASLLTNWGLGLDDSQRRAIREQRYNEAATERAEALRVLLEAREAWDKALELAPSRPDRVLLSNAGAVLQKLAVLDLRGADRYLQRAIELYLRHEEAFRFELGAVIRKRSLYAPNNAVRLELLQEALKYLDDDAQRNEVETRIRDLSARTRIGEVVKLLDDKAYQQALALLIELDLGGRGEAQLLKARALDGLNRGLEAADTYASIITDPTAQERAAELYLAEGSVGSVASAAGALRAAYNLREEALYEAIASGSDAEEERSNCERVRESLRRVELQSADLVTRARDVRSFRQKSQLLRDAILIAPSNFEAHRLLAQESTIWGRILVQEGNAKVAAGDREAGLPLLEQARNSFDEARVSLLMLLKSGAPFGLHNRIAYLDLMLKDIWPLSGETARRAIASEADALLINLGGMLGDRERDGGDVNALRTQLGELSELLAKRKSELSSDGE